VLGRRRAIAIAVIAALLGASVIAVVRGGPSRPEAAGPVTRWGYYVTWADSSFESLQANIGQLDIVSPYYYHVTPNGSIKSFVEPERLAFMQASGVKVIPLIQNEPRWDEFHKTFETPAKRDEIVHKLVDLVDANDYDGIHIDFEGINASDKDLLTDFMTRLYAAFQPNGWLVTQAVVARLSDTPTTWGGAYDYAALAEVNDLIVVMAYDHTPVGSETPGPVAPLWWVEGVVDYVGDEVPRGKLLLGVPFYGYDWNTKKGPPAEAVDHATADHLRARPNAQSGFDEDEGAPWVKYTDDRGDTHEVWYEDARSFEQKLQIATDSRLAGFAAWRIGHEDPANWTIIQGLATPATRIPPFTQTPDRTYFPETGHSLAFGFQAYWLANGGLQRFGYPRTEEFDEYDPLVGETYTVQYFERARFEWHPEYAGTPFAVLLGHLGRWSLEERGLEDRTLAVDPIPGQRYFPETGHNVGGVFLDYWERNGGLYAYGYPLTEEFSEVNPEDGKAYTVQYFERARFEHHPEYAGTKSEVLLGLLGNEMLRERGWIR
jgi:spore germination protein YaaH